ncbi:MAG: transcriptional repressor LexA [Patescibacteria group bacterium]
MLTKQQTKVLDIIKNCIKDHGYAPSIREIAEEMGVSSPATVNEHLEALVQKGFLKKTDRAIRNIELTKKVWMLSKSIELPLVGLIAAGEPIEAIEQRGETVAVPTELAGDENCYVLRVKGDSMMEDGILNGDYVIVERTFYPKNGDVVVALLDNEHATLKRYYREKDRIRLQPANKNYNPLFVKNPAIQGIVKGLIRKFAVA